MLLCATDFSASMNLVTLVIPFYNEASKFERFKTVLSRYLQTNRYIAEIILVDDGSTDDTSDLLQDFQRSCTVPCSILTIRPNKGKGHAISTGVMAATQAWVLCNDADFSYLPEQLDEWIAEGWLDLSQPERAHFGSRELGAQRGWVQFKWYRRIIGRIYAWLIRGVTGIKVTDTQCGFKMYPRPLAQSLFPAVQEQRFAFDVEVHYLLRKQGWEPKMLPVKCIEFGDSKVHLLKDSLQMGKALWSIRRHHS
jgi:dolichyl-phosphate beta-glucosyltransferase